MPQVSMPLWEMCATNISMSAGLPSFVLPVGLSYTTKSRLGRWKLVCTSMEHARQAQLYSLDVFRHHTVGTTEFEGAFRGTGGSP
jgi:hypothetical protein